MGSTLVCLWAEARTGRRHERAVAAFHADFMQHLAYPALYRQYEQARAEQVHPEAVARYRAGMVTQVLTGVTLPFRPVPATEFTPAQGRSEPAGDAARRPRRCGSSRNLSSMPEVFPLAVPPYLNQGF